MLLTDDQRAALEAYVAGETCAPHYPAVVNDMLRDFKKFGVCEWLLAADARLRATADADRALARIGAMGVVQWLDDGCEGDCFGVVSMAESEFDTIVNRARELAQEGHDG